MQCRHFFMRCMWIYKEIFAAWGDFKFLKIFSMFCKFLHGRNICAYKYVGVKSYLSANIAH